MQKKPILLNDIQSIIAKHGMFSIGEVLDDNPLKTYTRGNLDSFVEELYLNHAIVVVYNNDYSVVDTYRLPYSDMSVRELESILDVCLMYQQQEQED